MSGTPAAFLDRDGTIIHDFHFVDRPEDVLLIPGAGHAIRRLNEANRPVIIVTNQSGIARGFFTMADYERVQARMAALLAAEGARIDAAYLCPHHPDISGHCACRKPGTLLFEQAAIEHDVDLVRSAYAGDRFRDVQPGLTLGGLGILVPNDETPPQETADARARATVCATLGDAVTLMLRCGS